jgi:hypothetical protein
MFIFFFGRPRKIPVSVKKLDLFRLPVYPIFDDVKLFVFLEKILGNQKITVGPEIMKICIADDGLKQIGRTLRQFCHHDQAAYLVYLLFVVPELRQELPGEIAGLLFVVLVTSHETGIVEQSGSY